jgi:hypothetical protein
MHIEDEPVHVFDERIWKACSDILQLFLEFSSGSVFYESFIVYNLLGYLRYQR